MRGSIQRFVISKIKTDVSDNTVSLSALVLRGFNADFDGDEMNGYLALDEWMSGHLDKFAPHTSALDLGKPFTISKALTIPSPIITSISNWMYKGK